MKSQKLKKTHTLYEKNKIQTIITLIISLLMSITIIVLIYSSNNMPFLVKHSLTFVFTTIYLMIMIRLYYKYKTEDINIKLHECSTSRINIPLMKQCHSLNIYFNEDLNLNLEDVRHDLKTLQQTLKDNSLIINWLENKNISIYHPNEHKKIIPISLFIKINFSCISDQKLKVLLI